MGEPVLIADLAKKMISLSGLVPNKEVKIEYCGLRPGEKLYEELLYNGENIIESTNKYIKIVKHVQFEKYENFIKIFNHIINNYHEDINNLKREIKKIVPEYNY
jgi:FlaA1/EpsC-like NDP-sugar epimerase